MNLTITVEDETLERARTRALEEDTSVNAVLRKYLGSYAGTTRRRRRALESLLHLSTDHTVRTRPAGWTRDELHER